MLGDFGDLVEALAPLGDLEGLGDLAGGLRDRFRFISATFSVGDRFEKVTLTRISLEVEKNLHLFFQSRADKVSSNSNNKDRARRFDFTEHKK